MGYGHTMGAGMGIVMIIFWIVLIGAFILLITGAINEIRGSQQKNEDDSPKPILVPRPLAAGRFISDPDKFLVDKSKRRKELWTRYLDRLNKATGGKPPSSVSVVTNSLRLYRAKIQ